MMTPKCLMDFSLNLVYSLIFAKSVFGNIIDTSFPIVIYDTGVQFQRTSENAGKTEDNPNHNYFGYSLAFLKGYQSDPKSTEQSDDRSTIFIGAPNETQTTYNFGVVWRCEFNGNANTPVRCSILKQISEVYSSSNICPRHKYFENETQQWIGSTLSIHPASRELLTCAPRWKINDFHNTRCTDQEKMPGACYLSNPTHTLFLNPLNRRHAYSSTSTLLYRFAQFGFSSHFADSGQLIVGAPSTDRWTGAMVEVNQLNKHQSVTVNKDFPDIKAASLHGYSVTSGRTRSGGSYFASGAPRAIRLYGAVTITYPWNNRINEILQGDQFGSYFGYALATLDLTGDRYDELLVGAPFYTPKDMTGQSMTSYNTGCVFIFNLARLERTRIIPFKLCIDPQRVSGGSRFGSAISRIGDINFDYYEDFAISAPYDDNGQGTIFIYHGGFPYSNQPAQVIRGKSLNIENLRGFGTYLLGGEHVDFDGNATPDLVVGAFQSRHVVILRTRPVATANIRIGFYEQNDNGYATQIMRFSPTQRNLIARACVRFRFSVGISPEQIIHSWLSFELGSKTKQVQFDGNLDKQETQYSFPSNRWACVDRKLIVVNVEEVDSENNSSTIQVRARFKYNQTESSETQLVQHANVPLPSSSSNQHSWNEYKQTYNSFNAYLPVPIPPIYSDWAQLSVAVDNCDDDGDPQCNAELKLQVKLLVEVNAPTQDRKRLRKGRNLTIGKFDFLIVQIEMSNDNGTKTETAYNPELRVTIGVSEAFDVKPNSLDTIWELAGKLDKCKKVDDTSEDTKAERTTTTIIGQRCAQVVHPGRKIEYRVKIGNWGNVRVGNSSNEGFLTLEVEAFPQQNRNQSVLERIQVPLQADVKINVKSSVPPDQLEIDPGLTRSGLVDISQYFIITNNGSSGTTMEAITAEILVPTHANLKGKLTEVIGVADPSSLNIRCSSDNLRFFVLPTQVLEGQQNSSFPVENNDTVTAASRIRSKRSTNRTDVSPEKLSVKKSNDKYITLSGCEGDAQKSSCQKIVCKMDLLPRATAPKEIRLQMYILKNVFGELVTLETKGIRVTSIISVFYQGRKVTEQTGVTQRNFSVVEGISALILLGAGAGGTILLILIVFVLFKCGFFRRKTKEDLKQLKRQTMLLDQNAQRQAEIGLQALMENDMHEEVAL